MAIQRNDGWLPVKIINPLSRPVTLRRNAKVAVVFPCMALEDFHTDEPEALAVSLAALQQQMLKMDGFLVGDNVNSDGLTIDSGPVCGRAGSEAL